MRLTRDTIDKLTEILAPLMSRAPERQALVMSAFGPHSSLLHQVNYTGTARQFIINLVKRLEAYGEIEPGKPALWVLLEAARDLVGSDQRQRIDALLDSEDMTQLYLNELRDEHIRLMARHEEGQKLTEAEMRDFAEQLYEAGAHVHGYRRRRELQTMRRYWLYQLGEDVHSTDLLKPSEQSSVAQVYIDLSDVKMDKDTMVSKLSEALGLPPDDITVNFS